MEVSLHQALYELCVENSIIIALLFLLLVWYLDRRFGFNFMQTSFGEANNYCDDENCVRCNKYNSTSVKALTLLPSVKDGVISFKIEKGLDCKTRTLEPTNRQKPNVFYYDQLTAISLWNKQHNQKLSEDCTLLEKSYPVILEEYSNILEDQTCGAWKKNRTPYGSWDVFHLINQGDFVTENGALCPRTSEILNTLTSVMKENVFGNVMFSVLKPGTSISPHYGPSNIRLRCHLGLRTTPNCSLTVDGVASTWEDGKCLVFDDSFLHSVDHSGAIADDQQSGQRSHRLNITDNGELSMDRVVLIVDLWHPDLSAEERDAINTCFHP